MEIAVPPRGGSVVYGIRADAVSSDQRGPFEAALVAEERARADGLPETGSRRFAAGRATLRWVAGRALDQSPRAVRLEHDEHGKPRLAGGEVAVSVSHSGPFVVVALASAGCDVGVDVEQVGDYDPRLAGRTLSAQELATVEGRPAGERAAAFTRAWVVKEASLKVDGGTVADLPGQPAGDGTHGRVGDLCWWVVATWPEVRSAVAVRSPDVDPFVPEVRLVTADDLVT